jgi:hypothetical protein
MKTVADSTATSNQGRHEHWDRKAHARHFDDYRALRQDGLSERAAALKLAIPRSTLQAWRVHAETLDSEPQFVAFFESAAGLAFLHRLLAAMHLVFVELGACGIRLVCRALELAGLDRFIACSFEAQRRVNVGVQERVIGFAKSERGRLAANMPIKDITIAQDETFSGGMTLVAIEPESGYIILEQPSKARDAESWKAAMDTALAGLKCNVVQSTSDEAKGILAFAENALGAHHSPDLFHVQQELTRGVSGPMAAKERAADKAVLAAEASLAKIHGEKMSYESATPAQRGPGRPPIWDVRIMEAEKSVAEATAERRRIQGVRAEARQQIKGFGEDYHFADPKTGERSSGSVIEHALQQRIYKIASICEQEHLGAKAMDRILKAERVLPKMAATIDFVSGYVRQQVDKLELGAAAAWAFHAKLIPAQYLERLSARAKADERARMSETAVGLAAPLFEPGGVFAGHDAEGRERLSSEADRLARIFQRSSSCVEGRNGVLAFRHQELRGIKPRKLECLGALHNFFIKRRDDTTAAERFYEAKPRDLFRSVLDGIDVPRPQSPARKEIQKEGKVVPFKRATADQISSWPTL